MISGRYRAVESAALLAVALASCPQVAKAFNSEEHKVLVDRAVAQITLPASVELPFPTRYEDSDQLALWQAYPNAKNFAVGFAANVNNYEATVCFLGNDPDYPSQFDDQKKGIQDTSYWTNFIQLEGNFNIWIPPQSMVDPRVLYVTAYLDNNARVFTLGDLVSIYGDYRRTTHCVDGRCDLTNGNLTNMTFPNGTDCFGIWPFQDCGYRPVPMRADHYLRRIAAGLWPPYGCLGNVVANTATDTQWNDAGWWGDEMMRIANSNDWHFSSAAVAWYVGLHRKALLAVDEARTDPSAWNKALHYEANALHSLTDLFCFGHIVTNRDETTTGIIRDRSLTGHDSYLWMEHVIATGGGFRDNDGIVRPDPTLPAITERANPRNEFMETYQGDWAIWSKNEHSFHGSFNKNGATVRNLLGERFEIRGDAKLRGLNEADIAPIEAAVRESVEALFEAWNRLRAGEPVDRIGAAGSSYFAALKRLPVFVEKDHQHKFDGRWVRYAHFISEVSGSKHVPADWDACEMQYINGGKSLPSNSNGCAIFPEVHESQPIVRTMLRQNVPNPFNPTTNIRFELVSSARVQIQIFDVAGRQVRQLVTGEVYGPGSWDVPWDGVDDSGREVGSGVYVYRLKTPEFSETKKMALLR